MSAVALTLAILGLAAVGLGGVLASLFHPRLAGEPVFKQRFELIAGSTATDGNSAEEARRRRSVEETLKELDQKQAARQQRSKQSLVSRMRQAGLGWSKSTYSLVCAGAGIGTFLAAMSAFGAALPALGFGLAGGLLLPHFYVNFRRNSRFKRFSAEFPNAVDVIVRGVKAGLPLVDCLKIIAAEAQEPVKSEFKTIVQDQTVGLPLDEAVQRLPERVPLAEASFFGIVIAIQSRTGGSLSEALGNLSKVLRERKKMQSKIKAMSSEAKASAGIIGSLPVIVAGLVYLTSPDYITLLFTTTIGNVVLVASGLWMLIGCLVMRKMINFDF